VFEQGVYNQRPSNFQFWRLINSLELDLISLSLKNPVLDINNSLNFGSN
jgi:hypothetical protein